VEAAQGEAAFAQQASEVSMSYSSGAVGMGWSELPWYYLSTNLSCPGGSIGACVTSDPVDQAWARARVGTGTRCTQVRNALNTSVGCTTRGNNPGTAHCCRQLTSYQETLVAAGVNPYAVGSGATICSTQRVTRDSLGNAQQRAVWDVQEKLCAGGQATDPGPVNGVINDRLREALRQFQRSHSLTVNGQVDAATASALGFSTAEALAINVALAGTPLVPEDSGVSALVPIAAVVGVGAVGLAALLMWRRKKLGLELRRPKSRPSRRSRYR
jgi:hypothetical protein